MAEEETYSTIRDSLGCLIGKKVIDVTQQDADEWEENKQAYVQILYEDGLFTKFFISDEGFMHNCDED